MPIPASLPLLNINSSLTYPNATAGFVQLIGGGVVVSSVYAVTNARIFLSYYSINNAGRLYVAAITPSTNTFTIGSTNPNDTSVVCWFIVVDTAAQIGPIAPDTYGYPLLSNTPNAVTYGVVSLLGGTAFVSSSYVNASVPILLSLQTKSTAGANPVYYIDSVFDGSGFRIKSSVPFDNAQVGYWILYPTYSISSNTNLTIACPWLDGNLATQSYGKGQFSVGGLPVEISTTRAAFNVIVFASVMQTNVNRQNISLPYLFGINEGVSIDIQTIDSFFNDTSQFAWMMLLST